jgi:P27 family predicted phage terminase small subunit
MSKKPTKMDPPSSLTKYEATYWRTLVNACRDLEILNERDAQLFELAALAAGEYLIARGAYLEHGPTITTDGDRGGIVTKANPASTVMSQAATRLSGLLKDLGLGPAARSKMNASARQSGITEDTIGKLLNS